MKKLVIISLGFSCLLIILIKSESFLATKKKKKVESKTQEVIVQHAAHLTELGPKLHEQIAQLQQKTILIVQDGIEENKKSFLYQNSMQDLKKCEELVGKAAQKIKDCTQEIKEINHELERCIAKK